MSVEVSVLLDSLLDDQVVRIRSTSDPVTRVTVTHEEWIEFIEAVKKGVFDL